MNQELLPESEELLSYLLGGDVVTIPHSDKNIKTAIAAGIEHCLIESGIMVQKEHLNKFRTVTEEFDMIQTDDSLVGTSVGIGYEIDEDTWKVLKDIHEGRASISDELYIKWLSEAGLIVVTDSGRVILTEDAKTWISSTQ